MVSYTKPRRLCQQLRTPVITTDARFHVLYLDGFTNPYNGWFGTLKLCVFVIEIFLWICMTSFWEYCSGGPKSFFAIGRSVLAFGINCLGGPKSFRIGRSVLAFGINCLGGPKSFFAIGRSVLAFGINCLESATTKIKTITILRFYINIYLYTLYFYYIASML